MEKEQKQKKNNILHKVLTIVEVVIIIFLFGISIFTILGSKNNGLAADPIFGISFLPVQSNSMSPKFEEGDLVIGKKVKDDTEYEEGMIITYKVSSGSGYYLNTHRIIKIVDGVIYCAGDNPEMWGNDKAYANLERDSDEYNKIREYYSEKVSESNIVAVYKTRIKGLGNVFTFFSNSRANYTIFIMVPLLVLFLWNIYSFMKVLFESKKEKMLKNAVQNGEISEELKALAVQEYLAKQKAEMDAQNNAVQNAEGNTAAEVVETEKKEE